MKKELTKVDSLKLIGITVRTNNQNESDPASSKISTTVGRYWGENIASNFKHRKTPGITYSAYTDYVDDETGDYTYFIGELVDSFDGQNQDDFEQLIIPANSYQKFTTPAGKMPDIVINAWQDIWKMPASELGGTRSFKTDFEVYDQRAIDPNNSIVDIYIGIS